MSAIGFDASTDETVTNTFEQIDHFPVHLSLFSPSYFHRNVELITGEDFVEPVEVTWRDVRRRFEQNECVQRRSRSRRTGEEREII